MCGPVINTKAHSAQKVGRETIEPTKSGAAQKATLKWKMPMGHASTRRTVVEEKEPKLQQEKKNVIGNTSVLPPRAITRY